MSPSGFSDSLFPFTAGRIPDSLGELVNLECLYLHRNQLSGIFREVAVLILSILPSSYFIIFIFEIECSKVKMVVTRIATFDIVFFSFIFVGTDESEAKLEQQLPNCDIII
jgi:hypothetical protein